MEGVTGVALVTGASRGVGRGAASALAAAGYRVYATGRNIVDADLPVGIIRIPCDHTRDEQTADVFSRIAVESGKLDILVNSAWGGYEKMVEDGEFTWPLAFWEQPEHRWSSMMDAGLRSAFVASQHAARLMVRNGRGLMVNISYWAAVKYIANAIYGISKAATDRMTTDTAYELKPHGVAVVSLYPGLVRTEAVLEASRNGHFDLANSESPELTGRVIAALAADPKLMQRTGEALVVAALAIEYGIVDIDGKQPRPITLEEA
jgi:dehydrogenase/reductase SDR family protein 1